MSSIIQVENLTKRYGRHPVLNKISFRVEKGQSIALLGPNGAGKSTTLNILSTSIPADSGEVIINNRKLGMNNRAIRKDIGVVFQNGLLDYDLTIIENLFIRGHFYHLGEQDLENRIMSISEITGITSFLQRPYGSLSGGQRRRCDIARALIPNPSILFLDEPTAGLDPEIQQILWQALRTLKQDYHMTILLTTHDMKEAALSDYIIILKNGKIIAEGTPSQLEQTYAQSYLLFRSNKIDTLRYILSSKSIRHIFQNHRLRIPLTRTADALPILNLCKGNFTDFEVRKGSLNEAYFSIIEEDLGHA